MTYVTINIVPPGQAAPGLTAATAAAESAGPPPDGAFGGADTVVQQGPPPAELGGDTAADTATAPPPSDAMGLANGAHYTAGAVTAAPAPAPLNEVDSWTEQSL